ncbi:hypothetical protein GDO81_019703 [Engystomops pustulosus]|uniref:Uncharacterized protein n=1 Tax=Engystomops pustulosus TaxID=76066 RepID=A0AAV6Z2N8_ENGPU|nr:hypothetical protein GDO81_019703 [Engystomops pustulosus]
MVTSRICLNYSWIVQYGWSWSCQILTSVRGPKLSKDSHEECHGPCVYRGFGSMMSTIPIVFVVGFSDSTGLSDVKSLVFMVHGPLFTFNFLIVDSLTDYILFLWTPGWFLSWPATINMWKSCEEMKKKKYQEGKDKFQVSGNCQCP